MLNDPTPENIEKMREAVTRSPKRSVRKQALALLIYLHELKQRITEEIQMIPQEMMENVLKGFSSE